MRRAEGRPRRAAEVQPHWSHIVVYFLSLALSLLVQDVVPSSGATTDITDSIGQTPGLLAPGDSLTPGDLRQATLPGTSGSPGLTHTREARPSLSHNLTTTRHDNATAGANISSHRNLISGALLSLANPTTPSPTACLDQLTINGTFVSPHPGDGWHESGGPSPTTGASLPPCNSSLALEDAGQAGLTGVEPFLFDRGDVRGALIALYTVVFITGFVGKLWILPLVDLRRERERERDFDTYIRRLFVF